ncbi:hypothetical protein COL26b_012663 [Colletotrichum chrysophilum]|uniref:uncharacterized protein n=1 Tax=Colletotrichum chrysophilum TaxID=1836956 RepID=UPI002300F95D|nr:uncharacterized protein COL26b_012663 [Colletotrichum chrysophilum]KAJ0340165.1 hypothetical protein KNSL1_011670 [Colletotrichum chrysophilum]KAJ0364074.1 hypothetical protein COL26b_012663 [Colletotrichum chrysophilum]
MAGMIDRGAFSSEKGGGTADDRGDAWEMAVRASVDALDEDRKSGHVGEGGVFEDILNAKLNPFLAKMCGEFDGCDRISTSLEETIFPRDALLVDVKYFGPSLDKNLLRGRRDLAPSLFTTNTRHSGLTAGKFTNRCLKQHAVYLPR